MAKKGEIARAKVKETIINAFGTNFVAEQDKKLYVMAQDESGEMIQFAIAMTMPKVPIGSASVGNSNDWTETNGTANESAVSVSAPTATAMSAEDEAKVQELMKQLGICD